MKFASEQVKLFTRPVPHSTLAPSQTLVKNGKVPEGRYSMSLSEFRTFKKDCIDYAKLSTGLSDEQIVIQIRAYMDTDLKRAIDTNYGDNWNNDTVVQAVEKVGEIVSHISNPAVYRKQFDEMNQGEKESIKEYVILFAHAHIRQEMFHTT